MTIPKHLKHLFDINYIKRNTPNYNSLSVKLQKIPMKGVGLIASKNIKKGAVIAFYRMKVFSLKTYHSPTHNAYTFTIYTPKGNESKTLIGDLSIESLAPPCDGIPFWAYFSNEPSDKQVPNAMVDEDIPYNYKNRKTIKAGDTVVYRLIATTNIKKGSEIVWCYGEAYHREYEPNCEI